MQTIFDLFLIIYTGKKNCLHENHALYYWDKPAQCSVLVRIWFGVNCPCLLWADNPWFPDKSLEYDSLYWISINRADPKPSRFTRCFIQVNGAINTHTSQMSRKCICTCQGISIYMQHKCILKKTSLHRRDLNLNLPFSKWHCGLGLFDP